LFDHNYTFQPDQPKELRDSWMSTNTKDHSNISTSLYLFESIKKMMGLYKITCGMTFEMYFVELLASFITYKSTAHSSSLQISKICDPKFIIPHNIPSSSIEHSCSHSFRQCLSYDQKTPSHGPQSTTSRPSSYPHKPTAPVPAPLAPSSPTASPPSPLHHAASPLKLDNFPPAQLTSTQRRNPTTAARPQKKTHKPISAL
jgi:hypothetical protein